VQGIPTWNQFHAALTRVPAPPEPCEDYQTALEIIRKKAAGELIRSSVSTAAFAAAAKHTRIFSAAYAAAMAEAHVGSTLVHTLAARRIADVLGDDYHTILEG
jgi:GrpB-like predicted nucleotidyltransferase (UPF0157 family)